MPTLVGGGGGASASSEESKSQKEEMEAKVAFLESMLVGSGAAQDLEAMVRFRLISINFCWFTTVLRCFVNDLGVPF